MKSKVYIESSVISYLTAKPSRDLIVRANQKITKEWWATAPDRFDLFVSAIVMREISSGDKEAAKARVAIAEKLIEVDIPREATQMASLIMRQGIMPKKAQEDALHIAIASYARHEYLITWNCRHIANAEIRKTIEMVARKLNVNCPIICTPQELMGME